MITLEPIAKVAEDDGCGGKWCVYSAILECHDVSLVFRDGVQSMF